MKYIHPATATRPRKITVLGAGGHGKVVISTLQAAGHVVTSIHDDDAAQWGHEVLGVRIVGPLAAVDPSQCDGAVIALGNNALRKRIAGEMALPWLSIIHPTAVVHDSVDLGPGSVIFAGAIIQPGTALGSHVIVNTAATIDHDCVIEDYVHLAPGVHLAGSVRVNEGVLVGVGGCVIPGRQVGRWATVGAGGVVIRDVPDGDVVVGVPAEPKQ